MYEIKLSDGTKIKDLGLNGNNYISQTKIEDSLFDGKLSHVEITDKETGEVTVINDAVLIQNKQYGDEWWFILAEKSQQQRLMEVLEQTSSDITDVEIALAEIYEIIVGGN